MLHRHGHELENCFKPHKLFQAKAATRWTLAEHCVTKCISPANLGHQVWTWLVLKAGLLLVICQQVAGHLLYLVSDFKRRKPPRETPNKVGCTTLWHSGFSCMVLPRT